MGSTNFGNQTKTFDYFQEGKSEGFNKLLYGIIPTGVVSGGTLSKVDASTIAVSPMICYISDLIKEISLKVKTSTSANISVSSLTPFIICRMDWLNLENNYMDILALTEEEIESGDLIIGRCIYVGATLQTYFDYSRKSIHPFVQLSTESIEFNIQAQEPYNATVYITAGKLYFNSKLVDYLGGNSPSFTATTTDPRIDLLCINDAGVISIVEGTASPSPVIPTFPNDKLVLAMVSIPAGKTFIEGSFIERISYSKYIDNYITIRSALTSELLTHVNLTNPHSATSLATADRLVLRDASGRARIAEPDNSADIATKNYVDVTATTAFKTYGLGVSTNPGEAVVTNADTAFTTGLSFRLPAGSTGNPFSTDSILSIYRNGAGQSCQLCFDPVGTSYGRTKTRFYSGSAWSTWENIHYGEDINLTSVSFPAFFGTIGTLSKKRPTSWVYAINSNTGTIVDTRISNSGVGMTQIGKTTSGMPFFLWAITDSSNIIAYWNTTSNIVYSTGSQLRHKYAGIAGVDLRRSTHNLTGAKTWYWYTTSGDTTIKVATYGTGLSQVIIDSESVRSISNDVTTFGNLQYLSDAVSGTPTGRSMVITTDGYLQIFDFNGTTITAGGTYQFSTGTLITASYDAVDIEWLFESTTHDYFGFSWLESVPSVECYFSVIKVAKTDDAFTLVQGPTAVPNKVNKALYGAKVTPIANHGFFLWNSEAASAGLNRMAYYKYNSSTEIYDRVSNLDFSSPYADLQAIYMASCRIEMNDDWQGFANLCRYNATFGFRSWISEYGFESKFTFLDEFL